MRFQFSLLVQKSSVGGREVKMEVVSEIMGFARLLQITSDSDVPPLCL